MKTLLNVLLFPVTLVMNVYLLVISLPLHISATTMTVIDKVFRKKNTKFVCSGKTRRVINVVLMTCTMFLALPGILLLLVIEKVIKKVPFGTYSPCLALRVSANAYDLCNHAAYAN